MGLRFSRVAGGVGRGNGRLHCWVRTPHRKIRVQFRGHKHTSLTFLVVTFYELRLYGVLRSSYTRSCIAPVRSPKPSPSLPHPRTWVNGLF
jgi:hypothetical protein